MVVSRDSRPSGEVLASMVIATLRACGRDVVDAGIQPTPTTGVLVRFHSAAGGIQISASHNPSEYNGFKLFSAAGRVIPAREGEKVLQRYRQVERQWAPHDGFGKLQTDEVGPLEHVRRVLATVNSDEIAKNRFRVLIDANHGAGGILGKKLLEALGCEVVVLGGKPDGQFAHPPEPTEENLTQVGNEVVANRCAVGFCQDPDADRLALLDEAGRYIGEEYTVALCVSQVLHEKGKGEEAVIVTNCATSRMSQDVAERNGARLSRSAVGEANVVDLMIQENAIFGGEGNGGPIDPRVGYVRDSLVGMARVLAWMARRQAPLSKLVDEIPRYAIVKDKVSLPADRVTKAFDALESAMADATANRQDGIRFDWKDRWLIVRASNTEPIVRVIAESPTRDESKALCQKAGEILKNL